MDLNFYMHLFNDSFKFPMSKTNLEMISGCSDAEKWVGALLRVSRDEPCMKICGLFVLKLAPNHLGPLSNVHLCFSLLNCLCISRCGDS